MRRQVAVREEYVLGACTEAGQHHTGGDDGGPRSGAPVGIVAGSTSCRANGTESSAAMKKGGSVAPCADDMDVHERVRVYAWDL